MGVLSTVSVLEIKARGSIKDADVSKLRRSYYDDGNITAEEADIIFALNDSCPVQDPAWADCFIETITDYIVDQAQPEGYLTAANAAWLIERVSKDGRVETKTEDNVFVHMIVSVQYFVLPDNGLVWPVVARDGFAGARQISNPAWMIGAAVTSSSSSVLEFFGRTTARRATARCSLRARSMLRGSTRISRDSGFRSSRARR